MVKAHLAILLIGLGANQAFTSEDDRDRHWAEGVYFPPVTTPSTQNHSPSIQSGPAQQIRRKQRSLESHYDSVRQHTTPQSLGYPVVGYDPYRPTEVGVNDATPAPRGEYVPEDYSLSSPKEYDEKGNGYRVNGFTSRENHYRDGYRGDLDVYRVKRHGKQWQGTYYGRDYDFVDSNRHGEGYRRPYDLNGYPEAMTQDHARSLDNPYYDNFLGGVPYHAEWNTSPLVDDPRILHSPWELLWPLSNPGQPYCPLR